MLTKGLASAGSEFESTASIDNTANRTNGVIPTWVQLLSKTTPPGIGKNEKCTALLSAPFDKNIFVGMFVLGFLAALPYAESSIPKRAINRGRTELVHRSPDETRLAPRGPHADSVAKKGRHETSNLLRLDRRP